MFVSQLVLIHPHTADIAACTSFQFLFFQPICVTHLGAADQCWLSWNLEIEEFRGNSDDHRVDIAMIATNAAIIFGDGLRS